MFSLTHFLEDEFKGAEDAIGEIVHFLHSIVKWLEGLIKGPKKYKCGDEHLQLSLFHPITTTKNLFEWIKCGFESVEPILAESVMFLLSTFIFIIASDNPIRKFLYVLLNIVVFPFKLL